MTNFAEYPLSIGELRANRSNVCCDWTVRDALINLLRDIDSGKLQVDTCFLAVGNTPPGNTTTNYAIAGASIHVVLGVAHRALHMLQSEDAAK